MNAVLQLFVVEPFAEEAAVQVSLVVHVTVVAAETVAASPPAVQGGLATFDGSNLEISMPFGFKGNNPERRKPCAALSKVVTESHADLNTPGKFFFVSASPMWSSC